jgi:hypothetical protein
MWGSQIAEYGPLRSVTVQVSTPVNSSDVRRFRPGPVRWKLCSLERSSTAIVYVPGSRLTTGLRSGPRMLSEKSGPVIAVSVFSAEGGGEVPTVKLPWRRAALRSLK